MRFTTGILLVVIFAIVAVLYRFSLAPAELFEVVWIGTAIYLGVFIASRAWIESQE